MLRHFLTVFYLFLFLHRAPLYCLNLLSEQHLCSTVHWSSCVNLSQHCLTRPSCAWFKHFWRLTYRFRSLEHCHPCINRASLRAPFAFASDLSWSSGCASFTSSPTALSFFLLWARAEADLNLRKLSSLFFSCESNLFGRGRVKHTLKVSKSLKMFNLLVLVKNVDFIALRMKYSIFDAFFPSRLLR